jgi:hypothetical protein
MAPLHPSRRPSCSRSATKSRRWSRSSARCRPTPANRLAQSLLKQIQTDPQTLLGREHFNYRVEPGESLSRIAGRFLKDVHLFYALARYNDIKVPRQLQGGQMIKVPGKQPRRRPRRLRPPPACSRRPPPVPPPAPDGGRGAGTCVRTQPTPARCRSRCWWQQEYRRGLALMAQQKPAEAIRPSTRCWTATPAMPMPSSSAPGGDAGGWPDPLLENTIKRLDAQLAQNPGNAAARAERDKAVADRERLLQVK